MPLFRRKPIIVKADRYEGQRLPDVNQCGPSTLSTLKLNNELAPRPDGFDGCIAVADFGGRFKQALKVGDYIVTGSHGERHVAPAEIFVIQYEPYSPREARAEVQDSKVGDASISAFNREFNSRFGDETD
jgi:hypothetical protein